MMDFSHFKENVEFASFDTVEYVNPCYNDAKHDHLKIIPIIATVFDPGLNSLAARKQLSRCGLR